jgi:hypothetical protein
LLQGNFLWLWQALLLRRKRKKNALPGLAARFSGAARR